MSYSFPICHLVLFVASVLMLGCSPIYYSPNTHQVPMLKKKGDYNLALAGNDNRLELQGSYALKEHLGCMLNTGFFFPEDDEEGDGGEGQFLEAGAGYFKSISESWIFESYGLAGFGNLENHFPSTVMNNPGTTGEMSANLLRYGLQPSFGFTSRFFDAAVSARLLGLQYFNLRGSLNFDDTNQVEYLKDENAQFLIEPAITLRAGYDFIKAQLQLGRSYNLSNSDFRQDDGHLTIGLIYSFR